MNGNRPDHQQRTTPHPHRAAPRRPYGPTSAPAAPPLPASPASPHATEPRHRPLLRCVVAGGAGAAGGMFVRLLARSGATVRIVDPAASPACGPGGPAPLRADITDPTPEVAAELRAADLVLLALPERVALAAVEPVAHWLRRDALLADTLSVKGALCAEITARAPGLQAVGLNPMCAPDASLEGRPVAAVVLHEGPRVRELLRLIGTWGGQVVRVQAADHDRLTAASRLLPHAAVLAFGFALTELGVTAEELAALAAPPQRALLDLLAGVARDTPEVFRDVSAAHPEARRAREALRNGVHLLTGPDEGPGADEPMKRDRPADDRAARKRFAADPRTNDPRTDEPSTNDPSTDGPRTDGPRTDAPRTDGPQEAALAAARAALRDVLGPDPEAFADLGGPVLPAGHARPGGLGRGHGPGCGSGC